MCSELLDWLIHREAWGIGGDLKKDASRFAKVNRVEVLAIHHRSDIEVEASQSLAPRLLLLISGRSPSHVMNRSSRNQSAPELRRTADINIRPRAPSPTSKRNTLFSSLRGRKPKVSVKSLAVRSYPSSDKVTVCMPRIACSAGTGPSFQGERCWA